MPYLLDGNNLIGIHRRSSRPTEEDRASLVAEIAGRLRNTRARALLFFDGPSGQRGSSLGNLTIRVPSAGSADDAIVREIDRSRAPGEIVVVTADRELARRVRDASAKVSSPAEFFERFGQGGRPSAPKAGSAPVDVDDWIRYFEDESNRDGK